MARERQKERHETLSTRCRIEYRSEREIEMTSNERVWRDIFWASILVMVVLIAAAVKSGAF